MKLRTPSTEKRNRHLNRSLRPRSSTSKRLSRVIPLVITVSFGLVGIVYLYSAHAAGPVDIYISPASGNYTTGGTVSATIMLNTHGVEVVGGGISASYPTSLLTCQSITKSANFPDTPIITCSGGSISVEYANYTTNQTGVVPIATANFTTVAPGSATVQMNGSSSAYDIDVNDVTNSRSGAMYTIADPVTPPPSSGGGGSSGGSGSTGGGSSGGSSSGGSTSGGSKSTGGSSSNTPAATPKPTAPAISDFTAKIESGQLKASWATDQASTSTINYGMSSSTLEYTAKTEGSVTSHLVMADISQLPAGSIIFVQGESVNAAGLSAKSGTIEVKLPIADDQTASPVLTVTVKNGSRVVKGAKVLFSQGDQRATSSSAGTVTFNILKDGEETISATYGNKKASQKIKVSLKDSDKQITLKLESGATLKVVAAVLLGLIVLGGVGYAIWVLFIGKNNQGGSTGSTTTAPSVAEPTIPSGSEGETPPLEEKPAEPKPDETLEEIEKRVSAHKKQNQE